MLLKWVFPLAGLVCTWEVLGQERRNTTEMRSRILLAWVIIGALSCLRAQKGTIGRLADQADAVLVGEVQSGRQTGYSAAFVLSTVRTKKGGLWPGDTFTVSWVDVLCDQGSQMALRPLVPAKGERWRVDVAAGGAGECSI